MPTPLFSESVDANRATTLPFRVSPEEKEFLKKEAAKRGIHLSTLIRACLRETLPSKSK